MSGGEYMEDAPEALPTIEKIQGTLKQMQLEVGPPSLQSQESPSLSKREDIEDGVLASPKNSKPKKRQDWNEASDPGRTEVRLNSPTFFS